MKPINETPAYTVLVDDNFHFMEEDERYSAGTFATLGEASAKCQRVVEASLLGEKYPQMTADDLYDRYVSFGDDPFIRGPIKMVFSSWDYARALADVLAGTSVEAGPAVTAIFAQGYRAAFLNMNKGEAVS